MAACNMNSDGALSSESGGAWSTSDSSGDDVKVAVGQVSKAMKRLRRLDKYEIHVKVSGDGPPPPAHTFEAAGLAEPVLRNVLRYGYDSPTLLQRYVVPVAVSGRDLIACAQIGSGKRAAFCLPVISRILTAAAGEGGAEWNGGGPWSCVAKPRALILVPTRELSSQVKSTHPTRWLASR
jgi:superfamily II DNA/RNA helicase